MAMAQQHTPETTPPDSLLRAVPDATPPPLLVPLEEDRFTEGAIADRIGHVVTDIKEEYQRNFSASNGDVYDMKRAVKRRIIAARIFQAFDMLDTVIPNPAQTAPDEEDTPDKPQRGKNKDDEKRDKIAWPADIPPAFASEYAAREKQLEDYDRGQLIDLVDEYYEHPVIRTTLALGRITEKGPLSEDSVAVQRVAALMIRSMQ